ncbi:MAG: DUF5715 family protein [Bacteroidaceae bacterium]
MKISKNRFLQGFGIIVVFLGIIRCSFPNVVKTHISVSKSDSSCNKSTESANKSIEKTDEFSQKIPVASKFFNKDGSLVKNKIYSVPNFGIAFPDQNDVQLISAKKYGVNPVQNRNEAEQRIGELVYIGSNPYYYVDNLKSSIPYLVPRAAVLLQDIARNFFDSLQVKRIPLHKIIITSVMRSKSDVEKLRSHNGNATQNSCHLYGTTVDICYNRYKTVEAPGENRRKVRNDTLKWVLSEVLNDMREQNRCHIKYEVHQGCFHITVK